MAIRLEPEGNVRKRRTNVRVEQTKSRSEEPKAERLPVFPKEELADRYFNSLKPHHFIGMTRSRSFAYETCITILDSIRTGQGLIRSASRAGISVATLRRWMEIGESDWDSWDSGQVEDKSVFCLFFEEIQRAMGIADSKFVSKMDFIASGGEGNWNALVWMQERIDPEVYNKSNNVNIKQDQTIKIGITYLDGEAWENPDRIIDASVSKNAITGRPQEPLNA